MDAESGGGDEVTLFRAIQLATTFAEKETPLVLGKRPFGGARLSVRSKSLRAVA
jgi:hypothetical protein